MRKTGVDVNAAAACRLLAVAMILSQGCQETPSAGPPPAAPSPSPAPSLADAHTPPPREALVSAAAGQVELRRGSAWTPVAPGDRVRAQDALRTAADGRADLDIGARDHLHVAENTEVKVAELSDAVHRFRLARGRIAAAYEAEGERVVQVEDATGGAVAEARGGRFSALSAPGTFAVSAQTGTVNLRAAGVAVQIAPGEQSMVAQGLAPSPSAALPRALLLKVAAAGGAATPCAALEGSATPGTELLVDGEVAPTDAAGRFRVEPRRRGADVRVVARDASGRVEERRVRCAAPTPAPSPRIEEMRIRWRE